MTNQRVAERKQPEQCRPRRDQDEGEHGGRTVPLHAGRAVRPRLPRCPQRT
jgi:hypothetical protein